MKNLADLPVGAKVKDIGTVYKGNPIIWKIMEHGHGESKGETALITDSVISFKCFDVGEPDNPSLGLQWEQGNGDYVISNIRQWLNSSDKAGEWYKPQHDKDKPPDYENEAGFLANFSSWFLRRLKKVKIHTKDLSGGMKDTEDLMFFLSYSEAGFSGNDEGTRYELFSDNTTRKAYQVGTSDSVNWWLRTIGVRSPEQAHCVDTRGSEEALPASYKYCGVRPACSVLSYIRVSDMPDTDGAYIFEQEKLAILADTKKDLGVWEKVPEFSSNILSDVRFGDSYGDPGGYTWICWYVDGKSVLDYGAPYGYFGMRDFKMDSEKWAKISNGKHTIKLEVSQDGPDRTHRTAASFTFTKKENRINFRLMREFPSDEPITKAVIYLEGKIPTEAKVYITACNNGYDENPTWEDVTSQVRRRSKIFFKNKTKTADKWKLDVSVLIAREKAEGECFINLLGINYD